MTVPPVPPSPPAMPPTPPAPPAAGATSPNRSLMIVLSYLWILAVVPLVVEKEDREVQWHAKHGLVLLIAELILWAAIVVVQMILPNILGCAVGIISVFLWIAIIVVHIVAIMKGVNGQRLVIPGVSQYADRF
jgi:uncharacterized membrane protein